ncbi:metalloregulator ArsR/SmtB family transcription factor [Paenibacillus koleovorans]|uniref:metalloregulator ArsR/SmtB family transcription factor n=1 Tax=Paenibacillus koleovorans TaxID=121608 RepID=UPI000FDB26A4|nr:metalloregulator ArsR/SmtB family transcription factor [Paenibacillus koleovorans]
MQLDKIVNYHKALADPTRVRMLLLLADGEWNGQALAEKLCLSTATITHHAAKLREVSLIHERRDKNTIYFSLNHYFLKAHATALTDRIYKKGDNPIAMDNNKATARQSDQPAASLDRDQDQDQQSRLEQSVLRNFITAEGRLKHIPAQLKKKLIVLEHMVSQLERGRKYTEKEINLFIKGFHDDFATLRREFIMHQFMYREQEVYELNPPELWTHWQNLR